MNELIDMTPEVAAMIWEYRLNAPDPFYLSDILKACADSGDCLPADLLLDAANMVIPQRKKTKPKESRENNAAICKAVWLLHNFGKLPMGDGLFERVGNVFYCSSSKVKGIWYAADERMRQPPPDDTVDGYTQQQIDRLLSRYPIPPN